MSQIKLTSNALIYLLLNGANAAIPFLLLPIITSVLSPSEYGLWGLFTGVTTFLTPLAALGLDKAAGRKYFSVSKDEYASYTGTTLVLMLLAFIMMFVIVVSIAPIIAAAVHIPITWVYCIPFYMFANSMLNKIKNIAANIDHHRLYALCVLGARVLQAGIVILLLLGFHDGVNSLLVSFMFALAITLMLSLYWIWQQQLLRLTFCFAFARNALRFGVPLVPYLLGLAVIASSSRFYINTLLSTHDVGLFTAANQISTAFLLFLNSLALAWNPWLMRRMTNKEHDAVKRATVMISALIVFAVLALSIILPPLAQLFLGPKYAGIQQLIRWLVISWGFFGLYLVLYSFILFKEQTTVAAKIVLVAVVINQLTNYYFIRLNGLDGAAQAAAVTYLLMFILTVFWMQRHIAIRWLSKTRFTSFEEQSDVN